MCERRVRKPNKLMSRETWDRIASEYVPKAPCTELSGLGEPTMHPDWAKMSADVQEKGNILYFPTNGTLLGPETYGHLEDSDRTRVEISLDASCEARYRKIRFGGNWDEVIGNARRLRADKPKARLLSTFTAGAYNIDDLPAFMETAASLGINEVDVRAVRAWALSPEKASLRYRKTQTEDAIGKAVAEANRLGVPIKVEPIIFAQGLENAGEDPTFVSYLDIVGLDTDPCGGTFYSGGTTGTTGCYDGKQPIVLFGGAVKSAEDVKPGDRLKCVNVWGRLMAGTVSAVRRFENTVLRIEAEDESGTRYAETVSPDHLYWCGEHEYVPAGALMGCDDIQMDGGKARVVSIEADSRVRTVYTWDFKEPEVKAFLSPLGAVPKSASTIIMPESSRAPTTSARRRVLKTQGVPREKAGGAEHFGTMVVTTEGGLATCGAKHLFGNVSDPFESVLESAVYQEHAAARRSGDFNRSPFCKRCERMM